MSNEIQTIKTTKQNNIMNSFIEDMGKNVNLKTVIIIEADSGLSKTKKIRIGYAGSVNSQDFKFAPTNYKLKTEKIQEKLFNPIIKGFAQFDKVTSGDFVFNSPEDFINSVFEKVEDGIDEDEE